MHVMPAPERSTCAAPHQVRAGRLLLRGADSLQPAQPRVLPEVCRGVFVLLDRTSVGRGGGGGGIGEALDLPAHMRLPCRAGAVHHGRCRQLAGGAAELRARPGAQPQQHPRHVRPPAGKWGGHACDKVCSTSLLTVNLIWCRRAAGRQLAKVGGEGPQSEGVAGWVGCAQLTTDVAPLSNRSGDGHDRQADGNRPAQAGLAQATCRLQGQSARQCVLGLRGCKRMCERIWPTQHIILPQAWPRPPSTQTSPHVRQPCSSE